MLILAWAIYLLLFLLEVVALIAVGVYVWSRGRTTGRRVAWTAIAVLTVAIVWGVFASPDNPVGIVWITVVVKVVAFAAATAAIWAIAGRRWAGWFALAAALVNGLAIIPVISDAVS